jgi:RimJ/RimL family protein N-acetyltransferase
MAFSPRLSLAYLGRNQASGGQLTPFDLRAVTITSPRLLLRSFTPEDAPQAFTPVTPTLARYMSWDPSPSLDAFAEVWREWLPKMATGTDLALVVRLKSSGEFLGMAGLHHIDAPEPEIGIWIKEAAHGAGYGREAVSAIIAWAAKQIGPSGFVHPVVVDNRPSRRLAESLGGIVLGTLDLRKPSGAVLDEVVYRIPTPPIASA